MALHYQTEYRLGKRGQIRRSYTGFQAFLAIVLDLVFGLLFEMVVAVFALVAQLMLLTLRLSVHFLKVNWKILVATMTLLVYVMTLPFALVHRLVVQFRSGSQTGETDFPYDASSHLKPAWPLSREV